MNLVKKPTDGVCDASRCTKPPEETFEGGTKLCARHAGEYKEAGATESGLAAQGGGIEVAPEEPSTAQVLTLLTPIRVKAEMYTEKLANYTITNQAQLDKLGEIMQGFKADAKAVEIERKKVVAPYIAAKKNLDAVFKPTGDALKKIEYLLKAAVSKFTAEHAAKKVALLKAEEHTAALAMPEVNLPAGTSERYLWRYEVLKPEDVPREFLMADNQALQAYAEKHKASAQVEGVRFFAISSIAVTT